MSRQAGVPESQPSNRAGSGCPERTTRRRRPEPTARSPRARASDRRDPREVRTGPPWRARRARGRSPAWQIELSRLLKLVTFRPHAIVVVVRQASAGDVGAGNRVAGAVRGSRGHGSRPAGAEAVSEDRRPRPPVACAGFGAALVSGSPRGLDDARARRPGPALATRLIDRADRVAAHRLSFFDLSDVDLGDPIDWNRDHRERQATPLGFARGHRLPGLRGDRRLPRSSGSRTATINSSSSARAYGRPAVTRYA